jgi:hypothetical protein
MYVDRLVTACASRPEPMTTVQRRLAMRLLVNLTTNPRRISKVDAFYLDHLERNIRNAR